MSYQNVGQAAGLPTPYVSVNTSVAKALGLTEAIVLETIHYLYQKRHGVSKDGEKWLWYSVSKMQKDHLPYLSEKTIKRSISTLLTRGFLRLMKGAVSNNTNGYQVNLSQIGRTISDPLAQPEGSEGPNPISKTTTDQKTKIQKSTGDADAPQKTAKTWWRISSSSEGLPPPSPPAPPSSPQEISMTDPKQIEKIAGLKEKLANKATKKKLNLSTPTGYYANLYSELEFKEGWKPSPTKKEAGVLKPLMELWGEKGPEVLKYAQLHWYEFKQRLIEYHDCWGLKSHLGMPTLYQCVKYRAEFLAVYDALQSITTEEPPTNPLPKPIAVPQKAHKKPQVVHEPLSGAELLKELGVDLEKLK